MSNLISTNSFYILRIILAIDTKIQIKLYLTSFNVVFKQKQMALDAEIARLIATIYCTHDL